ncbi:MAG: GNAT family protein [Paludibacteraceae bacterium]|nr:GNAT family protein [Paludibacteraceae bacterium]
MALLESDTILLRALEPEDLSLLYKWENNSAWWHVGNTINPYSKYILREYIVNSDKTIYENKQLRLMITLKSGRETIGMIDLFDYEHHYRRVGVGVLIDPSFQNQGFAFDAFQLLIPYCFDFLDIHTLYAHVLPENKSSITLFEKLGFEKTGQLKDWIRKENKYSDVFVYQLIRDGK